MSPLALMVLPLAALVIVAGIGTVIVYFGTKRQSRTPVESSIKATSARAPTI